MQRLCFGKRRIHVVMGGVSISQRLCDADLDLFPEIVSLDGDLTQTKPSVKVLGSQQLPLLIRERDLDYQFYRECCASYQTCERHVKHHLCSFRNFLVSNLCNVLSIQLKLRVSVEF